MHTAFLPPLVLPLLFTGTASTAAEEPLDSSIKSGTISTTGQCLGGHTAECLVVELSNRTDQPISTAIPAGWLIEQRS